MMMKYSKRVAGIILCAAMAGNLLAGCSANQKTETAADKAESEVYQTNFRYIGRWLFRRFF